MTALFTAAALGSKEEAVLLPIVLLAWHALVGTGAEDDVAEIGVTRGLIAALMFPTVVYLGLRLHAGAMTPFSAPPYYQLTTEPVKVLRNALEYADRSTTISVVAFGLAFLAWRVRPVLTRRQIRLLAACIIWTVAGFAVTLFVPVRSSLYAVFPSVGAAVACGVLLDAMLDRAAIRSAPLARLALVFGATLLAAIPIYRDRNGRYVEPARLSERALRTIAPQAAATPDGAAIVLHDVDDAASNFVGAFGTFATSAVRMRAGRNVVVWIDPPPGGWQDAGLRPPPPRAVHAEFGVDRGRIFKVGP